jgi:hypothetical protein
MFSVTMLSAINPLLWTAEKRVARKWIAYFILVAGQPMDSYENAYETRIDSPSESMYFHPVVA